MHKLIQWRKVFVIFLQDILLIFAQVPVAVDKRVFHLRVNHEVPHDLINLVDDDDVS